MRTIMLVQFPIEPSNTFVRGGKVADKMKQIPDDAKPESVYFTERDGHRGGILIVDVAKSPPTFYKQPVRSRGSSPSTQKLSFGSR